MRIKKKISDEISIAKKVFGLTAVIVEDQPSEVEYLKRIISDHFRDIEITSTFRNSVEAIQYLVNNQPDILFLDIEMPQILGTDIARMVGDNKNCTVVFVTGHKEYAIDALKLNIPYYLLKPFRPLDVIEIISRIKLEKSENRPINLALRNKILVRKLDRSILVNLDDILFLEADGQYTSIYLASGEVVSASKSIKFYKEYLQRYDDYLELSRSLVIRVIKVKEVERTEEGGLLIFHGGVVLALSKPLYADISAILEKYIPKV